jgi:glycine cleavage system aminomethyltransferase T
VRLPGPIRTPAELTGLNGSSGRVTSAALSPRLGWIGLAVVRPQAMEGKLAVDGAPVEIVELPFPEALPANRQV